MEIEKYTPHVRVINKCISTGTRDELLNLNKIAPFLTSSRTCLGYTRRSTPKQRAAHVALWKALRAAALRCIPASRFSNLFPGRRWFPTHTRRIENSSTPGVKRLIAQKRRNNFGMGDESYLRARTPSAARRRYGIPRARKIQIALASQSAHFSVPRAVRPILRHRGHSYLRRYGKALTR